MGTKAHQEARSRRPQPTEYAWNREEQTKPRTVAGLARFFAGCSVAISARYIHEAIRTGGYQREFGNMTSARHFLQWKADHPEFRCRFRGKVRVRRAPERGRR